MPRFWDPINKEGNYKDAHLLAICSMVAPSPALPGHHRWNPTCNTRDMKRFMQKLATFIPQNNGEKQYAIHGKTLCPPPTIPRMWATEDGNVVLLQNSDNIVVLGVYKDCCLTIGMKKPLASSSFQFKFKLNKTWHRNEGCAQQVLKLMPAMELTHCVSQVVKGAKEAPNKSYYGLVPLTETIPTTWSPLEFMDKESNEPLGHKFSQYAANLLGIGPHDVSAPGELQATHHRANWSKGGYVLYSTNMHAEDIAVMTACVSVVGTITFSLKMPNTSYPYVASITLFVDANDPFPQYYNKKRMLIDTLPGGKQLTPKMIEECESRCIHTAITFVPLRLVQGSLLDPHLLELVRPRGAVVEFGDYETNRRIESISQECFETNTTVGAKLLCQKLFAAIELENKRRHTNRVAHGFKMSSYAIMPHVCNFPLEPRDIEQHPPHPSNICSTTLVLKSNRSPKKTLFIFGDVFEKKRQRIPAMAEASLEGGKQVNFGISQSGNVLIGVQTGTRHPGVAWTWYAPEHSARDDPSRCRSVNTLKEMPGFGIFTQKRSRQNGGNNQPRKRPRNG